MNVRTEEHMTVLFRFQEFPVYQDALRLRSALKDLSRRKFPKEEDFVLRPQLWRALDSIILNIAEGSEKYSDLDFSKFLNQALGSLTEVVACLDCARSDGYITAEEYTSCLHRAENIYKQLRAFSSKVRSSHKVRS